MEKVYIEGLGTIEVPPQRLIDFPGEVEKPFWDIPEESFSNPLEDDFDFDDWEEA